MLEGYRPKRIVRFYPPTWKVNALPREEELRDEKVMWEFADQARFKTVAGCRCSMCLPTRQKAKSFAEYLHH